MRTVVVVADGAERTDVSVDSELLELTTDDRHGNVRVEINTFRLTFLKDLHSRSEDLLRIAALVYSADTRVSRGAPTDVFAAKWRRDFHFTIPVEDPDFWNSKELKDSLISTLSFLTDDDFSFNFVKNIRTAIPRQGFLTFPEKLDPFPQVDAVTLFSGGLDSLAATIEAIGQGRYPLLVSHRPTPVLYTRQNNLVTLLTKRFPRWKFPHISMCVNRKGGPRQPEFTQRSRSFLFTALGAVAAHCLDVNDIRLCDNGVVSINLPQSAQNVSTFNSRSTHPKYITLVQQFLRCVTGQAELLITNTLALRTKKEVLELIKDSGNPDLIQEAISCVHVEGATTRQPHCGVCTQCIDRRFASCAAGLMEHDLPQRYAKDIFTDELVEGTQITHAENYIRFAATLERIPDATQFLLQYPELYDCLPNERSGDFAQELWKLFQRHQEAVNNVLSAQLSSHAVSLRKGTLPEKSLLRLVASGSHLADPRSRYIERLRGLLTKHIPPAFQTETAKNEKHVQDVGQSVFGAALETLKRESPQLPFGTITTKPDFSHKQPDGTQLFVEFKYVKERKRLNAIMTEMTSRVTIYRQQGAWILFIVYDPRRAISDDDVFGQDLERHEGVWVGITR